MNFEAFVTTSQVNYSSDFVFHRSGISFVAVHDCFWTHACSVDEMNKVSVYVFNLKISDITKFISMVDHWEGKPFKLECYVVSFFLIQYFLNAMLHSYA